MTGVQTCALPICYDIFVQEVGAKEPINVSDHIDLSLTEPTFSPDRKQIACRCSNYGLGIYALDSDILVEKTFIQGNFHNPAWSNWRQDYSSYIAVESYDNIYVIFPENWAKKLVINNGSKPCWSPDAKQIAYIVTENDYQNRIYKNNIYINTVFIDVH